MDDLFLKIANGEIPSEKIYEDAHTCAFLDIRPINKGHVLVIPRRYYRNVFDIKTSELAAMMETAQKVARALKESMHADGVTLVMNNERAGGQEVFHAHIHVIPRFVDDRVFSTPAHHLYAEGEMSTYAATIRDALRSKTAV